MSLSNDSREPKCEFRERLALAILRGFLSVPAVYLGSAFLRHFANLAFSRINKLRSISPPRGVRLPPRHQIAPSGGENVKLPFDHSSVFFARNMPSGSYILDNPPGYGAEFFLYPHNLQRRAFLLSS